jgi:hypothetical protein
VPLRIIEVGWNSDHCINDILTKEAVSCGLQCCVPEFRVGGSSGLVSHPHQGSCQLWPSVLCDRVYGDRGKKTHQARFVRKLAWLASNQHRAWDPILASTCTSSILECKCLSKSENTNKQRPEHRAFNFSSTIPDTSSGAMTMSLPARVIATCGFPLTSTTSNGNIGMSSLTCGSAKCRPINRLASYTFLGRGGGGGMDGAEVVVRV